MTARPRKDETAKGCWRSEKYGEQGYSVRARERKRGGPVVLDSTTNRAEPTGLHVRDGSGKLIPAMVRRAEAMAADRAAQLRIDRLADVAAPTRLTVEQGHHLFHHPTLGGMPRSIPAIKHHRDSRNFWTGELGGDTQWNLIAPATVQALAYALADRGRVQTADKRVKNLRTVHRWLSGPKAIEGLKDPTRGLDFKRLWSDYEPKQPRFSLAESRALIAVRHEVDPRFALMLMLDDDSGARSAALRRAMRSMLDEAVDMPPTRAQAPFGWLNLPAMKGQGRALVFLTLRQRLELTRATWRRWNGARWAPGLLSALEARWLAAGEDYHLIPGGHLPRNGIATHGGEIANNTPINWLHEAELAAGIRPVRGRGWHGIRRGWSDAVYEAEGLDVVTQAGHWVDRSIPESIYLSSVQHGMLARAREVAERRAE